MNARTIVDPELDAPDLPWSREAEQSVLGALMLDPGATVRLAEAPPLEPAHFFDAAHARIWRAIGELVRAGAPVDVVTVFERLGQAGSTDDDAIGDGCSLKYLNLLAQSVPSAANLPRYAEIVRSKALHREVIGCTDRAWTIARAAGDPDEKLDQIAAIFANVRRPTERSAPRRLSDLMPAQLEHWQAVAAGDTSPGIPTGFPLLDRAFGGGLKPGKVIVVAARPSVGKTSLALQVLLNAAKQQQPGLLLSMEMPAGELLDRAAANLAGVPLDRISGGGLDDDDWGRMSAGADAARALPLFVDDQPALGLLDIRAKARRVKQSDGLAVLVVDYLQLCSSTLPADRRHHQIEHISRGLKQLAKELDITVIALSQLSRAATKRDEPELDDLKESGAIEEDADAVLLLHPWAKQGDSIVVLAKLAKNRGGKRGRIPLEFDGRLQRWDSSTADIARRSAGASS